MRILILSSRNEKHSGNFGENVCTALRESGHVVDYNFPGAEKILDRLQNRGNFWIEQQIQRVIDKYTIMRKLPMWKLKGYYEGAGYKFFVGNEYRNVFPPDKLLKKIGSGYDLVITMFFPDFLNMRTVEAVCKKLKCPVLLFGIDDYPMTGGCYYSNQCGNFSNDCRFCPAFGGKERSIAYNNAMLKKRIFSTYDIRIMVNSWMRRSFEKSSIINPLKLLTHSFIIDEDFYKPRNMDGCRTRLGIAKDKTIVLSMRYHNMERKGCDFAIEAINNFMAGIDKEKAKHMLLITFGVKPNQRINIDTVSFDFVNTDTLIDIYCASTMFLSPSIADAGPSTVNQAICCGTPVVAFEIGTAIDVIENGISGYRAKYKDVDDYSRGIEQIAFLNEEEYSRLRESTREIGVKMNSKKSFVRFIEENFSNQTK